MENCPCNPAKKYAKCCELFITGIKIPKTPEELMRSRYTAYTLNNTDYIAKTMKGPAAQDFDKDKSELKTNELQWLGLKIIKTEAKEDKGFVEFIASYSILNKHEVIYEKSEFHKENGSWYYYDGITPKIGRNDSCPCGSQKKFKKCCNGI